MEHAKALSDLFYLRAAAILGTRLDGGLKGYLESLDLSLIAPHAFAIPTSFSQAIGKDVPYRLLSVDHVLRNPLAEPLRWYQLFENPLLKRLREDEGMVAALRASPHPYSLLGMIASYDDSDPMKVSRRPLLVTPDLEPLRAITWERRNTSYAKQNGLSERRITREEFISRS